MIAVYLASAGCEEPRPSIVWEGEHLRFGTREDPATICAGTFEYADAFVEHVANRFGESNAFVDYYWVPDRLDDYCPSDLDGCAFGSEAFAPRAMHPHELTHAARSARAYLPIEEGIAELYGGDEPPAQPWDDHGFLSGDIERSDVARFLAEHERGRQPRDFDIYLLMGHFASYLHAWAGQERLVELADRSTYDASFDSFVGVFESVYDNSLESVAAAYQAYPVCDQTRHVDNSFDCGRNVVELPREGEDAVHVEVSLACDDPAVVGSHADGRFAVVTFQVPTTARYQIEFRPSSSNIQGRMRRCGMSCFDEGPHVAPELYEDFETSQCLLEGRYVVRLDAGRADQGGHAELDIAYSARSSCP